MTSSSGEKREKQGFRNWLKSEKDSLPTLVLETDANQKSSLLSFVRSSSNEYLGSVPSNSAAEWAVEEDLGTGTSARVKEGLEMAGRFVQTLLKELPNCIDSNPVKMALSIVKAIITIKDQIGDNKDTLAGGLQNTEVLLSVAMNMVESDVSEDVKREIEDYKSKIDSQNQQLHQIEQELKSKIRHIDYENYKKKIDNTCKAINDITSRFALKMQLEIRNTTAMMHEQIKEDRKERLKESLRELLPSAKADHRTVIGGQQLKRETCSKDTRVKILKDITEWANDGTINVPPVFWLTGQAGSGKTTIAYTIAKRFEEGETTILGANFLCSRQFEETQNVNRILPTIAYQLALKFGPYASSLHDNVTDISAVVHHDISEQMKELLVVPWSKCIVHNAVHLIVIDALDEIEDSAGSTILGKLLTTINEHGLQGLKFLVTSRTDPKIESLCSTFPPQAVCRLQNVSAQDAESDIKTYLEGKLPALIDRPELFHLLERTQGLFLYAATFVKILCEPEGIEPSEQIELLATLLSESSKLLSTSSDNLSPIDELYRHILYRAFSKFTGLLLTRRLLILYTFLCAAERISPSIAAMLMDTQDGIAKNVVEVLHAVLYIQDGRVYWYHTSFVDFVLAESRSRFRIDDKNFDFWCNPLHHHKILAQNCFRTMQSAPSGLRFNIGDIPSSYMMDSDHTEELSKRVSKNIPPVLKYSCFYWAFHIQHTRDTLNNLHRLIMDFLQIHVLFWIEAMNLLESVHQCNPSLYKARDWVLSSQHNNDLTLVHDLQETALFVTHFAGSPAAESTPHLYISSLATWKKNSRLSQNWKNQFSRIPIFTHAKIGNDAPLLNLNSEWWSGSVGFSKDGTRIILLSFGRRHLQIWDASTGKELITLDVRGEAENGNMGAISSDEWFAAGSGANSSNTIRVWDISTGRCLKVLQGHTGHVASVAISKDGLWIASGSYDKSIRLWDVSTGAVKKVMLGHNNRVTSVAFSGDGAWIASGSYDGSVQVWDTSNGENVWIMSGHSGTVASVAFAVDVALIVSGSWDKSVRLWDATTGKELKKLEGHIHWVNSVAISANGAWVVSGSLDGSVRIWNASTGETLKVLLGNTDSGVDSVSFSSDLTRVLSASRNGSVRVWNVSRSIESKDLEAFKDATDFEITSIGLSSKGTHIIFGHRDGSVHVWDATRRQELKVLGESNRSVASIAFSDDGMHIAWVSGSSKVWLWHLSGNALLKVLESGHVSDHFDSVAVSKDGSLIASTSLNDRTVRLWDATRGNQLKVLTGHTDWVSSVAFSNNGQRIVSGSWDKSVRIWDVPTGECLKVIEGQCYLNWPVALSSDAAWVVFGSTDSTARVWDASATGTELQVLRGHDRSLTSIAFSRNDAHIVSSSEDNTVRVWDATTGKELHLRGRQTHTVVSVAFLSDGSKSIISGSIDGSVIIWDLEDPVWYLKENTAWILSSSTNDRLMWVPYKDILPPKSRILFGENYNTINIDDSTIGSAWSKCYTGY